MRLVQLQSSAKRRGERAGGSAGHRLQRRNRAAWVPWSVEARQGKRLFKGAADIQNNLSRFGWNIWDQRHLSLSLTIVHGALESYAGMEWGDGMLTSSAEWGAGGVRNAE